MQAKKKTNEQAGVTQAQEEMGACANITQASAIKEEIRSHMYHISRTAIPLTE